MTATQNERTWTAKIAIDGELLTADPSANDTLRETARAAEREAAEYLRNGFASEARVIMFKRTRSRGVEEDRQSAFLWVEDGRVFVDRHRSC